MVPYKKENDKKLQNSHFKRILIIWYPLKYQKQKYQNFIYTIFWEILLTMSAVELQIIHNEMPKNLWFAAICSNDGVKGMQYYARMTAGFLGTHN